MNDGNAGAPRLVEREARLFEAGDYPDKGLSVTEDDLDRMADGFTDPVPIHLEHRPGPLRFGWLVKVWRKGSALFGKLAFTSAAWELLKESGARALSLGLNRRGLTIEEVSIVGKPRVAGARVFNAPDVLIHFDVDALPEEEPKPEAPAELAALRRDLSDRDAREDLRGFSAAGKIAPGAESAALALLAERERLLCFAGGESVSVAEAFRRFLEAQPPVVLFGETAAAGSAAGRQFDNEERRVFQMLGLTDAEVASALAADESGKGRS